MLAQEIYSPRQSRSCRLVPCEDKSLHLFHNLRRRELLRLHQRRENRVGKWAAIFLEQLDVVHLRDTDIPDQSLVFLDCNIERSGDVPGQPQRTEDAEELDHLAEDSGLHDRLVCEPERYLWVFDRSQINSHGGLFDDGERCFTGPAADFHGDIVLRISVCVLSLRLHGFHQPQRTVPEHRVQVFDVAESEGRGQCSPLLFVDVALGEQDPIAENLCCYPFDMGGLLKVITFMDKDLCVRLGAASGISNHVF